MPPPQSYARKVRTDIFAHLLHSVEELVGQTLCNRISEPSISLIFVHESSSIILRNVHLDDSVHGLLGTLHSLTSFLSAQHVLQMLYIAIMSCLIIELFNSPIT